jgi:hypothetical protein
MADLDLIDDADKALQYVDFDGEKRYLASIPSGGLMASTLPNYEAAGNPMFPRSDWFEMNRRGAGRAFDTIFNQGSFSSCVGNGWAGALQRARAARGATPFVLSPAFVYSLINGGRDRGAVISDGIGALTKVGTCLFSTVGQSPIYSSRMPEAARAEAARFRISDAYHCRTWDEVVSAILSGLFVPTYGMQVGSNFNRFDSHGVAGHNRGPGNHAMHADGVKKLPDGRWVIDNVNSWGTNFGDGGRCYLDEEHLFDNGNQADVCVIRAFVEDPLDPVQPPAAKV